MKPLEFKIELTNTEPKYLMRFYYENGEQDFALITRLPKGLELNKHYSITDIYGYKVVDDRKGL